MKKILTYIIIIVVLAAIVIGGKKLVLAKQAAEAKLPLAKNYALFVKTIKPKISNVTLTLPYLCIVKSGNDITVASKISARIKMIKNSGDIVKKGEVIALLDDTDFIVKLQTIKTNISSLDIQIKSKKVALKNLRATHKRTIKLLEVKGASKEQFDREVTNIAAVQSGIKVLKLKIKELNENKKSVENALTYTTIKAPIDGVIKSVASVGDISLPGRPLEFISGNTDKYLLVKLPDDVKARSIIFRNKKINLIPLNTTFNGLIEYRANISENLAVNQRVKANVVVFDAEGIELPYNAILDRNGKSFVVILKGDKAIAKKIHIAAEGQEGAAINGASLNDKIVVAKPDILLKLLTGISVKGI